MSSSRRQFGRPEKSSPSHHTVPASSASRSVGDIGGINFRNAASTPSLISLRRSRGTASASANATNSDSEQQVQGERQRMRVPGHGKRRRRGEPPRATGGIDVGKRECAEQDNDKEECGQHGQ